MSSWLNRTTKEFISSASPSTMKERFGGSFVDANGGAISTVGWIKDPDLSAVVGFETQTQYWLPGVFPDDTVGLMTPVERAAQDAADLAAQRDAIVNQLNRVENLQRAIALVMLDEINELRAPWKTFIADMARVSDHAQLKLSVASYPSFNPRTLAEMQVSVREKLGT